jgi:hypothetical protein
MTLTDWLWVGGVALVAVVDVALVIAKRQTLSQRFWHYGKRWPIIWFGAGFVVGHLVW